MSGSEANVGSPSMATLIFTVPLRDFHRSMSSTKSAGRSRRSSWRRKVICGCVAATTRSALNSVPSWSATPTARPSLTRMRSTGEFVRISAPKERGAARDGRGHGAHATDRVAPGPHRAAHAAVADVADRVVQHDVRRAGLARTCPGADDAVDRHHPLHLGRLEPVVEQVGDAHREQPGRVTDLAHVEPTHAPGELELVLEVAGALRTDLRRGLHEQRARGRRRCP